MVKVGAVGPPGRGGGARLNIRPNRIDWRTIVAVLVLGLRRLMLCELERVMKLAVKELRAACTQVNRLSLYCVPAVVASNRIGWQVFIHWALRT